MNTYQLSFGTIWWLEPWCIVNVINMRLCLSLPRPLFLLFYQVMFHWNTWGIKLHIKLAVVEIKKQTQPQASIFFLLKLVHQRQEKVPVKLKVKKKKKKTSLVSGHFMLMPIARWWNVHQHMWAKLGEDRGLCGDGGATVESSLPPARNCVILFFNQIF